jgi:hypothetical protein
MPANPLQLPMEQNALKMSTINNYLNTDIYSYLETSGACTIKLLRP